LKVVVTGADGKVMGTFEPTTPVLLFPLDVVTPLRFQSTGVAPDGSSLTVSGTVTKRARVDACGTIIDGWEVQSTQQFQQTGGLQGVSLPVNDTYHVAPQLGGLFIYEAKSVADSTGTVPTVIDSIAQLKPSPIPAKG
jgi:hypothetical protein